MTKLLDRMVELSELERFFTVADAFSNETGQPAFMPICPVDEVWHQLLETPVEYRALCLDSTGKEIAHLPATGSGQIAWQNKYESLYGKLPKVWFSSPNGDLDEDLWNRYNDSGSFQASWDCVPGFVPDGPKPKP